MYCRNCGSKIEEDSVFCGSCGNQVKRIEGKNEPLKNDNKTNRQKQVKKKKRKKGRVIGFVVVCILLCVAISGAFIVWKYHLFQSDVSLEVKDELPETDMTGISYYEPTEDELIIDSQSGTIYYERQLLVTLDSIDNKYKLEEYIEILDGSIVGEIEVIADYQILLESDTSLEEMEAYIAELKQQDWVIYASLNYAIEADESYIPDSEEWDGEWESDNVSGANWGLEAINMEEAWDNIDKMTTAVNIGVFDSMFATGLDDLSFAEEPLGNVAMKEIIKENLEEFNSHGTHVSGIIAAGFDNGEGIDGIVPNSQLYGVAYTGLGNGYNYESLQSFKVGLAYLIINKQCSVINMSCGFEEVTVNAAYGCENALNELEAFSEGLESFLKAIIEDGYDNFVICKASGNHNDDLYFAKDIDDEYEYDYYSHSAYLEYLDEEEQEDSIFERYKDSQEEIEERLIEVTVDAKYDMLGAIDDPVVAEYIIVVGAVENIVEITETGSFFKKSYSEHVAYEVADDTTGGDRVDVVAPGNKIYSTISEAKVKFDELIFESDYGYKNGTSMAAPHVSGVAGLIFSINPELTGPQVKEIICSTTSEMLSDGENTYGLLDASAAVEMAMTYSSVEEIIIANPNTEETEEFVSEVITLDEDVEEGIEDLIKWYTFAIGYHSSGMVATDEASICERFLNFSYHDAYENLGSVFDEIYSNITYYEDDYFGVTTKEIAIKYLENSIGMSDLSNLIQNLAEWAFRQIDIEEYGIVQTEDTCYITPYDLGNYWVYDYEIDKVETLTSNTILATGIAMDGYDDDGRIYYHLFEVVLKENEDSPWGGYTLDEVVKWEVYISPYSNSEYLTVEDLEYNLSDITRISSNAWDEYLRYMRNEIYARHGYTFGDEELAAYFESQEWYNATTDFVDESELNQYELANIELIVELESGTTDSNVNNETNSQSIAVTSASMSELAGEWKIDTDMTMDESGISMTRLFGSGYKYGDSMTIGADSSFKYYIGIGIGGTGTCSIAGDGLQYSIKTYEESTVEENTMEIKEIDGSLYLIMDYYGDLIYWKK